MTTEERLEKLERELAHANRLNRRLIVVAVVCMAIISGWACLAQPDRPGTAQAEAPAAASVLKEVRARSFVLEDENGKTRADLAVGKDGVGMAMFDENGKTRVGLATTKDGSRLRLFGENQVDRTELVADKDGGGLGLVNDDGKIRVGLIILKDGAGLTLSDASGQSVLLKTNKDGPGTKANATLILLDQNNKVRASLGLVKEGPALGLFDENGKFSVLMRTGKDGPRLGLLDENGKVVWQAP